MWKLVLGPGVDSFGFRFRVSCVTSASGDTGVSTQDRLREYPDFESLDYAFPSGSKDHLGLSWGEVGLSGIRDEGLGI